MTVNQIRNWKIHNFLFLALLFGFYGCAGTEVTPVYGGSIKKVQVWNDNPWQESSIIVDVGDELFFETEGRWSIGDGKDWMCSAAGRIGNSMLEPLMLPETPCGALIGRTGGSRAFPIGVQGYQKVSTPGVLYLAMNECPNWYHDNKPVGSIAVTVHHKKASLMENAIQKTNNTQSTTTPWGDIPVVSYRFEAQTRNGELSVDINGKGIEVRKWIIENIGEICSSQNIVLEAGKEPTEGGRYQILKESVENGILTIEFQALY